MDGAGLIELSDHPGLAFVNSTARPQGVRIELLGDGADYVSWLRDALLVDGDDAARIEAAFSGADLDAVAAEARQLREELRPVVAAWADGADLAQLPDVRDRLNELLALDNRYDRIESDGLRAHRRWDEPRQILAPPAAAIADLLTAGDRGLARKCESDPCTLWFYDRTKAHRRRWCSMSLCGNRAKARAHRQRVASSRSGA